MTKLRLTLALVSFGVTFLAVNYINSNSVSSQTECVTVAPTSNCTPGFSVPPNDTFDPSNGCAATYSSPIGLITKRSSWNVTWPDGASTIFRATAGGQCLYTQTGCCFSTKYEYCWPLFHCPTVEPGAIHQLVIAQGVNHHFDDCNRIICRGYEVFDGCNDGVSATRTQSRACSPIGGGGGPWVDPCIGANPNFIGYKAPDFGTNVLPNCDDSPILIDTRGNGFDLTDQQHGIRFDLDSDGSPEQTAWTAIGSDEAFLALDRNGNGRIDNGKELFGNYTQQTQSENPNGFIALAEFDMPANGGNNDGVINRRDAIFTSLRLWQDTNHNGYSEPGELRRLSAMGLEVIDLDYIESRRTDQYGNQFRYRARVRDTEGAQSGRWAWDVFFANQ